MSSTFKPDDVDQLQEVVQWAVSEEKPLSVFGLGTKRTIGRPSPHGFGLDVSALAGVTLYEPEELVLSARAATPRSQVEKMMRSSRQEFAFEPPDLSALLGTQGSGTLGGMVASNLAGPRRIRAGAARDHFLGFSAISGRGERFKSGGRVVKNVTGYDLPKIMAGSWGTLAVMSDVSLKVLPAAETEATLVVEGLDDLAAVRAMTEALHSSCEVSGLAHLPEDVNGAASTAFRLEGIAPSVDYRFSSLAKLLESSGRIERLEQSSSGKLWRRIRDADFFADGSDRPVWRISVPPTDGPAVVRAIGRAMGRADGAETGLRRFYDWAGGLVWCGVDETDNARERAVRSAVARTTGHATLIRASRAVRESANVFEPPAPGPAALTRNLKEAFDPKGVLNPGRMYAGI